jgi:uncharacterized protein YbjT (DUF2867 family)
VVVSSRTALLLGGSGLVGRFCLNALLAEPIYTSVISVGRRELAHATHPKLVQRIIDLDALASLTLPQVDDVFCALGTTIRTAGSQEAFRRVDLEFPLAAARQSLKFGARQFVLVSSVGADPKSKNFYLRTKGEVEQALTSLPFKAVHILRPSLLLGQRTESRPGESFAVGAAKVFQFLCIGPLRRYHPISAMKVGRAMVAAAKTGQPGVSVYEYNEIVGMCPRE